MWVDSEFDMMFITYGKRRAAGIYRTTGLKIEIASFRAKGMGGKGRGAEGVRGTLDLILFMASRKNKSHRRRRYV